MYIVACRAHPALVKVGLILARIFHFNGLLVCMRLVKNAWPFKFRQIIWRNLNGHTFKG